MERLQLVNEKLAQITALKNYLSKTDYHNHKRSDDLAAGIENPYQIPQEVLVGRNDARNNINTLEAEVAALEAEIAAQQDEETVSGGQLAE